MSYEIKPDNVSKAALETVRADFNPSGSSPVAEAKVLTARLITLAQECSVEHPKSGRVAAVAVTRYEEACMWLVKALTVDAPSTANTTQARS